jgi:hypothetical protein
MLSIIIFKHKKIPYVLFIIYKNNYKFQRLIKLRKNKIRGIIIILEKERYIFNIMMVINICQYVSLLNDKFCSNVDNKKIKYLICMILIQFELIKIILK